MIHIHAAGPTAAPAYEIEDVCAITIAIRTEAGDADAIVNRSTDTGGMRLRELRAPAARRRRHGRHGGIPRRHTTSPRWSTTSPAATTGACSGFLRAPWMLVAAALMVGGSARVGLEDDLYLPDGTMARSHGDSSRGGSG
jgi:uncharacterized protein (DUF849 family)